MGFLTVFVMKKKLFKHKSSHYRAARCKNKKIRSKSQKKDFLSVASPVICIDDELLLLFLLSI